MQMISKKYLVSYGKDSHKIPLEEARKLVKARLRGESMVIFEDKVLSTSFLWMVSELEYKLDRVEGPNNEYFLRMEMREQTDKLMPKAASKVLPKRKVGEDNED